MDFILPCFIGFVVGFVVAALMNRSKFASVQSEARRLRSEIIERTYELHQKLDDAYIELFREKDLNEGLTQELAAAAKVV
jgi:hypothetical protein